MKKNELTFKEKLENVHEFPTRYVVKAIGKNDPEYIARVIQTSTLALGKSIEPEFKTIESSKGKQVSVRIEFNAPDAETIVTLYEHLSQIEEILFLL